MSKRLDILGSGQARADRVSRIAVGIMTLVMLVVIVRVGQLQIAPGDRLSAHMQERVTRRAVPAERGDIFDRRGRYLATSQFGFRVFVDPLTFPNPPHEAIMLLADVLDVPPNELGERIVSRMAINEQRLREREALRAARQPDVEPGLRDGFLSRLLPRTGAARSGETLRRVAMVSGDDGQAAERETEDSVATPQPRPLIRYVRISDVLEDERVEAVRNLGIRGVHLEQRAVREYPGGDLVASIVGTVGIDHDGLLGAEHSHDKLLRGSSGRMLYVRDARGRPLWMGPRSYEPPRRGEHLRLSIDLEIQRIARDELKRGVEAADAAGGRIVVMDPLTGEILAMADLVRQLEDAVPFPWVDINPPEDGPGQGEQEQAKPQQGGWQRYITITFDEQRSAHPALARNRCVEDLYEPGSTFKIFVWAALTEAGLAEPGEVFNTERGQWRTSYGRTIRDVTRRDEMTWEEVLIYSSNVGMVKAAKRMGFDQLHDAVRRFGFGSRTNVGLPGEAAGLVTPRRRWDRFTQTSVAFGNEVAVTPVQMVRAFAAVARTGELAGTLPPVTLRARDPDDATRSVMHRIMRPEVAGLTRETLRAVADHVDRRMAADGQLPEGGWRYTMFGKSGTAQIAVANPPPGKRAPKGSPAYFEHQYNSSFLAAGPVELPRLIVLVVIDDPGPELRRKRMHYGSAVAGPVVRRVLERSLSYMGVPPCPVMTASAEE